MAKEKMYEVNMARDEGTKKWQLATGNELDGGCLSYVLVHDVEQHGIVSSVLWREVIEGTQFTCPECGSHAFGTHTTQGPIAEYTTSIDNKYMGVCHGYAEAKKILSRHEIAPVKKCTFTWPREEDDKYLKGTNHYSPALMTAQVVERA